MDEKIRIEQDITMFEKNLQKIKKRDVKVQANKIVELANQYYTDSKYYLFKKDYRIK